MCLSAFLILLSLIGSAFRTFALQSVLPSSAFFRPQSVTQHFATPSTWCLPILYAWSTSRITVTNARRETIAEQRVLLKRVGWSGCVSCGIALTPPVNIRAGSNEGVSTYLRIVSAYSQRARQRAIRRHLLQRAPHPANYTSNTPITPSPNGTELRKNDVPSQALSCVPMRFTAAGIAARTTRRVRRVEEGEGAI